MTDKLHLREAGLWAERRTTVAGGPALFLDRDGVVVEEVHYLRRIEDVALTSDAGDLISQFNARGIPVVLVTNQAAIGRGIATWADFQAVQDTMHAELAAYGAHLDAVYACGYHEEASPPFNVANHPWRKPGPGMLLAAAQDLGIDLARSWIVGDRATDLAAGKAAGLAGGTLVETGYGVQTAEQTAATALASPSFHVRHSAKLAAFQPDPNTII